MVTKMNIMNPVLPVVPPKIPHGDFIVYVDESGDHSLASINPRYPVFVLSFCVFRQHVYNKQVAPALRHLKFATFGHDMVVLHETDIRKRAGVFSRLSRAPRERFLDELTNIIAQADFQLIAVAIDKTKLKASQDQPGHAYHLALQYGLQSLFD